MLQNNIDYFWNTPSSPEGQICKQHKLGLDFECSNCVGVKCCYKCFSTFHFGHIPCEESRQGQIRNPQEPQKEFFLRRRVNLKKSNYENNNRGDMKHQEKNMIKEYQAQKDEENNYKTKIDNLCVLITEEVWKYRRQLLLQMDKNMEKEGCKINSNTHYQQEQVLNFIRSIKSQISYIEAQESNEIPQYSNLEDSVQSAFSFQEELQEITWLSGIQKHQSKEDQEFLLEVEEEKRVQEQYSFLKKDQMQQCNEYQGTPSTEVSVPCNFEQEEEESKQESRIDDFQLDYLKTMKPIDENQAKVEVSVEKGKKKLTQLFIVLTNGKNLSLLVDTASTILQLKILIFQRCGVPPMEQKLFFCTKELHNDNQLKDYNIPKDSSIKQYIRTPLKWQSIPQNQRCQKNNNSSMNQKQNNSQFYTCNNSNLIEYD